MKMFQHFIVTFHHSCLQINLITHRLKKQLYLYILIFSLTCFFPLREKKCSVALKFLVDRISEFHLILFVIIIIKPVAKCDKKVWFTLLNYFVHNNDNDNICIIFLIKNHSIWKWKQNAKLPNVKCFCMTLAFSNIIWCS